MSILTAFLVTFLTANVPTLTGIGVSNYDQPILPLKKMALRGVILAVMAMGISLLGQVTVLQPIMPLLALVGVYGMKYLESQVFGSPRQVPIIEVIVYGGVLTIFSTFLLSLSPTTPAFYLAALGMVVTYFLTITLLQLSQRRLRLAVVPTMFEQVPLLAMTIAILAMIFTGFTAIF